MLAVFFCVPTLYHSGLSGVHDQHLAQIQKIYASLPHPAGTRSLQMTSELGILAGNGNHCDFMVGELRSYNGDKQAIQTYYGKQSLLIQSPLSRVKINVDVAFVDDGRILDKQSMPDCCSDESSWAIEQNRDKKLYIVYVYNGGYRPNGDSRCH